MKDEYSLTDSHEPTGYSELPTYPAKYQESQYPTENIHHTTEVHHHHYTTQINQTSVRYEEYTYASTARRSGRSIGLIFLMVVLAGLYVLAVYDDPMEICIGLGLIVGIAIAFIAKK